MKLLHSVFLTSFFKLPRYNEKKEVRDMRKRAGIILIVSGLILIIKPSFDFEMVMLGLNYIAVHYWPLGFIFIGMLLLWPEKKSSKRKR